MQQLTLVMGQLNPIVGDVAGNLKKVIMAANQARDEFAADVIVFPELMLTGYPAEDLLLRPGLMKRVNKALVTLQKLIGGIAVIVGHPEGLTRQKLYNAVSVIADGERKSVYFKQMLPNYGVFDEKRYFAEGVLPCVVDIKGFRLGLTVCEDIWFAGPATQTAAAGAQLIVNLNASPYQIDKSVLRDQEVGNRVTETGLPVVYVNQTGGQDELVFDGASFVIDGHGQKVVSAPSFEAGLYPVLIQRQAQTLVISGETMAQQNPLADIYKALTTGLRDYIEKNHFPGVVLGLSGGIDSALTLALAVDAIGADRVHAVMMPTRYTADMSLEDAKNMAEGLNVKYSVLPIESVFNQFTDLLSEQFAGLPVNTTEENIQTRCRGIVLMALSNKTGFMVLSTGNKSEMAVGYSTLYGDMAGGYAPLKDVYKTLVYELCHYRNQLSFVIPKRIIERPPSAELADDQYDEDSLPPYDLLDKILERYITDDSCFEDLVKEGFNAELVASVIKMVDRNEYKRRQAPPGIRISERAFGRDRRYPLTSGYTVTSTIE